MDEVDKSIGVYQWQRDFSRSFFYKFIQLLIDAYNDIPEESRRVLKLEEERRTEIVDLMRKKKSNYQIMFPITYESGEGSKRMDIICYLDSLSEEYYFCIECKRFIKKDIVPSHFYNEYYKEGIRRYEKAYYSSKMDYAGMAAFLETGDFEKLHRLIMEQLPEYAVNQAITEIERSANKDYYTVESIHHRCKDLNDLKIIHVLLDLTK